MPAKAPHEVTDLARLFQEEMANDAADLVPRFISETLPDMREMGRPKYLAWVRDTWLADVAFPAQLLDRLAPKGPKGLRPLNGLKAYLRVVTDAFKDQEDALPVEAAAAAMLQQQASAELPAALQGDAQALMGGAPPLPAPLPVGPASTPGPMPMPPMPPPVAPIGMP